MYYKYIIVTILNWRYVDDLYTLYNLLDLCYKYNQDMFTYKLLKLIKIVTVKYTFSYNPNNLFNCNKLG